MTAPSVDPLAIPLPPLRAGDRLNQPTFHARYERMPKKVKAELVGGVVCMPSPLKANHGETHYGAILWLGTYQAATPGVRGADNATVILGEFSEPQPDVALRIVPESGGRCRLNAQGYLEGPPELLVEISVASTDYDLNAKRLDYESLGVREYLVVLPAEQRVVWWVRRDGGFVELTPAADGLYHSEAFPGLWLDAAALCRLDTTALLDGLRRGLASPEHTAFVASLRQRAAGG